MSDKTETALLTVGVADIVNNLRYWAKLHTGKQRRYRVNHLGDQAADALEALARDKAALGDLLAIIHRDGGQYQDEHGTRKAVDDAHAVWAQLVQRAEEAEARIATLEAASPTAEER